MVPELMHQWFKKTYPKDQISYGPSLVGGFNPFEK